MMAFVRDPKGIARFLVALRLPTTARGGTLRMAARGQRGAASGSGAAAARDRPTRRGGTAAVGEKM